MRDILLYLVAVLIWGTTWFAITFQLGVVAIEWSLVYRFALATVLLFAICLATGRALKFPGRAHLVFLGLGAFLFSSNYYFSYLGVAYITSGLVAVVFSTLPLMNIFNGRVFLKRRLEPAIAAASLVGIGGIALMFWPELGAGASNDKALLGMVIVLIATYLASVGNTIAAGRSASKLPVLSMSAWGMLYGTGFLTAAAVCNYNPRNRIVGKIAKTGDPIAIETIETDDVLAELGKNKESRWVVGFALEADNPRENALQNLRAKNCDVVVLNAPVAIGSETNHIELIDRDGRVVSQYSGIKTDVARELIDWIETKLHG